MIAALLLVLIVGAGWALFIVGGYLLVLSMIDLLYVGGVLVGLVLFLLWRGLGGRTRVERAHDRIRTRLLREGIPDPDGWMGLGSEVEVGDHGIPYLR